MNICTNLAVIVPLWFARKSGRCGRNLKRLAATVQKASDRIWCKTFLAVFFFVRQRNDRRRMFWGVDFQSMSVWVGGWKWGMRVRSKDDLSADAWALTSLPPLSTPINSQRCPSWKNERWRIGVLRRKRSFVILYYKWLWSKMHIWQHLRNVTVYKNRIKL